MPKFFVLSVLGPCTLSVALIAEWCVSVSRKRCQGWLCVLYQGALYDWRIVGEEGWKRNPLPALLYYREVSRGPPVLTSPSNGRIAINTTYTFTINAVRMTLKDHPAVKVAGLSFNSVWQVEEKPAVDWQALVSSALWSQGVLIFWSRN